MKEKYNALFDKLAPQRSDEELLRAVLGRKAENMSEKKRFNKKAIIIPAIAAALVLCTSVGVSAVYEWNMQRALQLTIEKQVGDIYNITDEEKRKLWDIDFSAIASKPLDIQMKVNIGTVHIKGIAAAEYTSYLIYDVIFNEDYDYSLGENEIWITDMNVDVGKLYSRRDPGELGGNGGSINQFLGMEGNVAHFCCIYDFLGISLAGKTQPYTFGAICKIPADQRYLSRSDVSRCHYFGEKFFDVDIDFDVTSNTKVFPTDINIYSETSKELVCHIREVKVSPFCLYIKTDTKHNPCDYDEFYGNTKVLVETTDGETLNMSFGAASYGSSHSEYMLDFRVPINVDKIKTVTIDDTVITVNE